MPLPKSLIVPPSVHGRGQNVRGRQILLDLVILSQFHTVVCVNLHNIENLHARGLPYTSSRLQYALGTLTFGDGLL